MIPETAKLKIEEQSRKGLIGLIYEMANEISELRAEIARLTQPPSTSQNSSQPPSRDFKTEKKHKRSKKKGAKPGHEKQERSFVENPTKVIEAYVDNCKNCHLNLLDQVPARVVHRQVTEIPEIKPVVIETRQYVVDCPCCGERQYGRLPEGLEAGRYFGPRLEALVTNLHHEHHIGYKRLCQICDELFGFKLSAGGAVSIVERAGQAAESEAEAIGEQVRQSPVIGSDETSARVHGRNWWEWAFVGGNCEYHTIEPSRGSDVIKKFMRECEAEVWVCDCWKAQLNAPASMRQICLAHQIRNLQGLRDKRPRLAWAREMQALFRKAIHLRNRQAKITARGYRRQVTIIERQLQQLLKRTVTGLGYNLLDRYRKRRNSLFIFLHRADVPAHNNACERALRPSVIHRKVLGSFRSEWSTHAYASLATVSNTAKRNGQSAFQKLVQLMGTPVLPFLTQPAFA
ncbi:MAG: IS66 family transposase [Anaerolineae bacterium]|nr:IS66 family transposase [Anaerolineae bacterium]